jgi:hypothetical protein
MQVWTQIQIKNKFTNNTIIGRGWSKYFNIVKTIVIVKP